MSRDATAINAGRLGRNSASKWSAAASGEARMSRGGEESPVMLLTTDGLRRLFPGTGEAFFELFQALGELLHLALELLNRGEMGDDRANTVIDGVLPLLERPA